MQSYVGTKIINAKPMTRLEYNSLRGWTVPANENPDDAGYLVEYVGSPPNIPDYDGYVSWSPKETFEASYREINGLNAVNQITFEGHQIRVLAEHAVLKHRLMLLNNFLNDRALHALVSGAELYRMQEQQQYMQGYLRVLEDRIRVFAPALV